jgi:hypothetical protein
VSSADASAKLHYIVPSGVTTSEAGSTVGSTGSPYSFHVSNFSGDVNLTELTTTTSLSETLDYTIVGSNNRSVQLIVTVSADKSAVAPDRHCYATGTVTPIS